MKRLTLMLIMTALAWHTISPSHAAVDRTKPILFVHGYDFWGSGSDGNDWNKMLTTLKAWGWSSTVHLRLGYYYNDKNFDHYISHHGSHYAHQGGTSEHVSVNGVLSHTRNTQIEHLAYHLAWTIYDHFSKNGKAVEVVAHSMGGLIVREAIAQFQGGDPDRPPTLLIQDVVTLGTPHHGTGWAYGCSTDQCYQMRPGSPFLKWMSQIARNPQASGGTDWTLVGSYGDNVVSANSGVGMDDYGKVIDMDARHKVKYSYPDVDHTGQYNYMNRTSDSRTAVVDYMNSPGSWLQSGSAAWPVRWTDIALGSSSW
jgi:triacylglycerol esterase/lipase EstA (alpha/beta hydrolase family)